MKSQDSIFGVWSQGKKISCEFFSLDVDDFSLIRLKMKQDEVRVNTSISSLSTPKNKNSCQRCHGSASHDSHTQPSPKTQMAELRVNSRIISLVCVISFICCSLAISNLFISASPIQPTKQDPFSNQGKLFSLSLSL